MSSNHGQLQRDLIGGTLQIGSVTVLDSDRNLCVNEARIKSAMNVKGTLAAKGDLTVAGDSSVAGNSTVTGNMDVAGDAGVVGDLAVGGDVAVTGNVVADGLLCGEAVAVTAEIVAASAGLATIDPETGLSVVNGAANEGTTVVTLPDPSSSKVREKKFVAADVDGGVVNLIPSNYASPGVGLQFDADGEGATLVWAAGAWWCTGTCGGTPIII